MKNIFSQKNKDMRGAKNLLLKTFFNTDNQREAVRRAAKESAEDQRALLEQYEQAHQKTA